MAKALLAVPAILAASISAHWIVRSNPMDTLSYGHTHRRGQRLALSKNKAKLFIALITRKGARDATSRLVWLFVVVETPPNGHERLRGATNH